MRQADHQQRNPTARLWAPASYWSALPAQRAAVVHGCGPGDGLGDWIVPDTIWGLRITEACNIHDWMYRVGATHDDKEQADRVLLYNMLRLAAAADRARWFDGLLLWLRRHRAVVYYNAVRLLGGPAFWDRKNPPEEFRAVNLVERPA